MSVRQSSDETKTQWLESEILRAHAAEDYRRLSALYEQAAELVAGNSDTGDSQPDDRISDVQAFFLVQAYVFALNAGDRRAKQLKARLISAGRES